MALFFSTPRVWAVECLRDGRPRRRPKALPADAAAAMATELQDLHRGRARRVSLRPATPDEQSQGPRGQAPANPLRPTGCAPREG